MEHRKLEWSTARVGDNMKKGTLIIVSSAILLSATIVGTSLAVWATNPIGGVNPIITPSHIDESDVDTVVLSWGDKGLLDIENLMPGEIRGPFKVGLIADTSNGSSFSSVLTVTLTSNTSNEYKLIDYLSVGVYDDNIRTTELISITPSDVSKSKTYTLQLDDSTPTDVYFFVSLSDEALPYIDEITDEVTLTVDLSKDSGVPVVDTNRIYFHNVDNWSNVYAYAWNENGKTTSAWPGVKMGAISSDIFSIELEEDFTYIVFSDGDSNKTETLTIDLTKPYYDDGEWKIFG